MERDPAAPALVHRPVLLSLTDDALPATNSISGVSLIALWQPADFVRLVPLSKSSRIVTRVDFGDVESRREK